MIRIPATGHRIGSLLVNPGGPGASAVDSVAGDGGRHWQAPTSPATSTWWASTRRGVGHSTPALRCRTDAEFDAFRRDPMVDYSPAGVAHIEQLYQQLAQQCVDRMGTAFLANVGTASAARDMDIVRQAIGDDQINYLGFSYGTELGTAYVEQFGDHVRAMVLDGAIDPTVDPIERQHPPDGRIPDGVQRLRRGLRAVARLPAGHGSGAVGRPLPRNWSTRWCTSRRTTSDPRGLSYADAITGTVNALYTQQYWKYLTSGLLGLQRGTDAGDLLLLADDYRAATGTGTTATDQDAFNAIRCVDAPSPTDPAVWADADQQIREVGAVHGVRRVHRLRPARYVRVVAGAGDLDAAPGRARGARQGRRGVHHARSGHPVSGGRRSGPPAGRAR